jgi:hypothetical protein
MKNQCLSVLIALTHFVGCSSIQKSEPLSQENVTDPSLKSAQSKEPLDTESRKIATDFSLNDWNPLYLPVYLRAQLRGDSTERELKRMRAERERKEQAEKREKDRALKAEYTRKKESARKNYKSELAKAFDHRITFLSSSLFDMPKDGQVLTINGTAYETAELKRAFNTVVVNAEQNKRAQTDLEILSTNPGTLNVIFKNVPRDALLAINAITDGDQDVEILEALLLANSLGGSSAERTLKTLLYDVVQTKTRLNKEIFSSGSLEEKYRVVAMYAPGISELRTDFGDCVFSDIQVSKSSITLKRECHPVYNGSTTRVDCRISADPELPVFCEWRTGDVHSLAFKFDPTFNKAKAKMNHYEHWQSVNISIEN